MSTEDSYKIITLILLFLCGFLYMYNNPHQIGNDESDIKNMSSQTYIRFIYIGSSTCSYSNNEKMHKMVNMLKNKYTKIVHKLNSKILFTGITQDRNVDNGISFLKKTSPYDEIITGASWLNLGLDEYVWNEFQGPASTPQILITYSTFDISGTDLGIGQINRNERVLKRFVGIDDIENLYNKVVNHNHKNVTKDLFGQSLVNSE